MLVSVVMSLYRPDERFLAEQLDSIDAQDVEDMELVIYNDCPEDLDREAFCREHCTHYPLRYYHGERNLGYVKAFEFLVCQAQGDYIVFCDQDDRWLEGRVSTCLGEFDKGHLLVSCDRQVIDADGNVEVESWRAAHPKDPENAWHTGDVLLPQAVFTCYSIGMASMVRADVARQLMPYPTCTGHDKWLAMGAAALGSCAFVEKPLVQYRRHGSNVSGVLSGISCKADWYEKRVQNSYELSRAFYAKFPDDPCAGEVLAFGEARMRRSLGGMWRHRHLAPKVAMFEMALKYTPDWLFRRVFC